ncbi:hypothetical protein B0H19DRAFT_1126218 [Mycena capillaripes]|nr:hypothetical protein B0H19DRAFT_1170961 [Mycena capillaripes]KAJ6574890.1 hypothetical protein B0H19DRAFT_1126218 [Mycena capillaripes]
MAPSNKVLTPEQIVAGLCPLCQEPLTDVVKCTGYHDPKNKGRFYQQCSANRHAEGFCTGFFWRNDLATPTFTLGPKHCREPACAGVAGSDQPNQKNALCSRQACLGCCQAAARATPDAVPCKVSSHRRGLALTASSASTSVAVPATPIRTDYSQPLSPAYYAKLTSGAGDVLALSGPGSPSSNAQKSRYRVEEKYSIQVLYYTKDDTPPLPFTVYCPDYPHFHPSQDKGMVTVLGIEACEVFGVFSAPSNTWSIASSAQKVNIGRILRLRSPLVTRCQEPDVVPVFKRERSGTESEGSPTPVRRKRANSDVFAGDNFVSSSAPPTSPTMSIISINSTQPDEPEPPMSSQAVPSGLESLRNAPPGPRGRGWPFMYVVDMAVGFREMVRLQQTQHKTRAEAFPLVFRKEYNSSTYSDNFRIWEKSDKALKLKLEKLGRSSGGEWTVLTNAIKGKK